MSVKPGEQILSGEAGAAIRHHLPFHADHVLHQHAGDVARRADAGRAHGHLVGIGFDPGDQFLQIVRRHSFARVDQERLGHGQRHRLEIGEIIVAEIVDGAVGDVGAPHAPQHRVAVGCRALGAGDADGAGGAADVFHHDGLAQCRAHGLGHDAAERVGRAAGRERHDHGDRMIRIGLRTGGHGGGKAQSGNGRGNPCNHGFLPARATDASYARGFFRSKGQSARCDGLAERCR